MSFSSFSYCIVGKHNIIAAQYLATLTAALVATITSSSVYVLGHARHDVSYVCHRGVRVCQTAYVTRRWFPMVR